MDREWPHGTPNLPSLRSRLVEILREFSDTRNSPLLFVGWLEAALEFSDELGRSGSLATDGAVRPDKPGDVAP